MNGLYIFWLRIKKLFRLADAEDLNLITIYDLPKTLQQSAYWLCLRDVQLINDNKIHGWDGSSASINVTDLGDDNIEIERSVHTDYDRYYQKYKTNILEIRPQ